MEFSFLIYFFVWLQCFSYSICVSALNNLTSHIIATKNSVHEMNFVIKGNVSDSPSEEKLFKYLLKDYNPNIMPKLNMSEHFKLYFGLAMSQLINIVKHKNQIHLISCLIS